MGLALKIAVRFLKSGKGQTFLIVLGIAIGVSVQIFIGLLIQGLQESLVERTIGRSSQITVNSKNDDKKISDWKEKVLVLSKKSELKNLSVVMDSPAFIKVDNKSEPVLIRGFQFESSQGIYGFKESLTEGVLPIDEGQTAVGKDLKDKLGLRKGDYVDIITAAGKSSKLKISGFYDLKVSAVNKSWLLVNLKTAQDLFDFENNVTAIEMQIEDVFNADKIAKEVDKSLSDSTLKVDDWKTQNEQLLSGLNGQSISSIMIQVFVLLSVLLAIASVLAISVMQKSKQIGILKAMGVKDRNSSLIFLFQGLILGAAGAVCGVVLGLSLIYMFQTFAVNPDGTPVVEIKMNIGFIAFSGVIAVFSAMIAAMIPARKSSKLSPIEVIRNG